MSVGFTTGFMVKEFKATCPVTDMTFMRAYSSASSRNAKRFLQYLVDQAPFDIQSIRVDGGLLYGIASAHHNKDAVLNSQVGPNEQRRVWVPFHFLPGGRGETLEERLLCVMDSEISQEMITHHVSMAVDKKSFGLELLGIAAHVYMDTFSHYGFSGIGSKYNSVDGAVHAW